MFLEAFRATHFRCLHATDWIPLHDLTVLIGENDGGKTATLDALAAFFSGRGIEESDFCFQTGKHEGEPPRESEIVLEALLSLTLEESAALAQQLPLARLEGEQTHLVRRIDIDSLVGPLTVKAKSLPDQRLRRDTASIRKDDLQEYADAQSIDVEDRRSKESYIEAIRGRVPPEEWVDAEVEISGSVQQLLPIYTVFPRELNPERILSVSLGDIFSQEIQRPKYQGSLDEIKRSIATTLNDEAAKLLPYVQKYSPEIAEVHVEPRFDFERGFQGASLELKGTEGTPIPLAKRGHGLLQKMCFAVYEWNSEVFRERAKEGARHLILAFDEPDLHLDYAAQRKLFDIIEGFRQGGIQVVVATHSINFVDRVALHRLNHYLLDSERHGHVRYFKSTAETEELFLYQLGATMGLANSLMFFERCFLTVEGKTEVGALPLLFQTYSGVSLLSEGIRLLDGEGHGGVRLFARHVNQSQRRVVFLLDEDVLTGDGTDKLFTLESLERDGFDATSQAHFIGPKEFEHAFSNAVWADVGNKFFPKASGDPWLEEDIEDMRQDTTRKFGHRLRAAFRTDATTLGVKLSQAIDDVADIPEALRKCFDAARQLANP
jgi:predicted ATP-dependent endonuclease of OLD family